MHSYSINSSERWKILFFLAALSIGIVSIFKLLIQSYSIDASYITTPSAFAIYGLVYMAFDKYLWKIQVLKTIGIIQTPNISGCWEGEAKSSLDDFKEIFKFDLTIHQTWSNISLYLEAETKESISTMASINNTNPTISKIEWGFLSKNKPMYSKDEYMFYGVTRLNLNLVNNKVSDEVSGDYYTDVSRDSYGNILLKKSKKYG